MAYTLSQGIQPKGLDSVQRGLMIGLPALVLILSIGALLHRAPSSSAPPSVRPKTIPIVSSLTGSSGNTNPASSSSEGMSAGTSAPTASSSSLGFSSLSSPAPASGGSGGVVGGRGGGPTGGGSGVTIPDCSAGQVATVSCQVPACSPEVSLSPGQKAILAADGTCVVLN